MMKRIAIVVFALTFLVGCTGLLHNASNATITYSFVNFDSIPDDTQLALVGAFTTNGWTNDAYPLTFSGGAASVTMEQTSLDSILFRLVQVSSWNAPTHFSYSDLEPNAWDALDDDHAYESGDPNWGIGNSGEAIPSGGMNPGGTYTVTVDGSTTPATLSINDEVVWQ